MADNTPTDAEVMNMAEGLAHEMGAAAALYKFANDLTQAGYDPRIEEALVARLSPAHVELVRDLHAAPNKK